jgi:hypothetical protein
MKKIIPVVLYILLFNLWLGCANKSVDENGNINPDIVNNPTSASDNDNNDNLPVVTFEKETHDFGKIVQGEKISFSFKFKNTGNADLIISDAKGSCGCTVPKFPKEPIQPGKDGVIEVTFNSEGKSGKQNKSVTLITNAIPNTKVLTITGEVN